MSEIPGEHKDQAASRRMHLEEALCVSDCNTTFNEQTPGPGSQEVRSRGYGRNTWLRMRIEFIVMSSIGDKVES